MDLCGPKLRTNSLQPGPVVKKVRPKRNDLGEVLHPAHIWFYPENSPSKTVMDADVCLPVPDSWLRYCSEGDIVSFVDARGSKRKLKIAASTSEGCMTTSSKTVYFTPGLKLQLITERKKK